MILAVNCEICQRNSTADTVLCVRLEQLTLMGSSVLVMPPTSTGHSTVREYSETKLRSIEEARAVDCTPRQE
jgi:hypothetical protein